MFLNPGHRVFIQSAHRAASFGAVAFLIIHIITEILAQRVHVLDAVIPFLSPFRTFYIGLGTIASDLIILLVITGILRGRFNASGKAWRWRAIHYTSYLSFVFGVWHGLLGGRPGKPYVDWSYGFVVAFVLLGLAVRVLSNSLRPKENLSAPPVDQSASSASAPLRAAAMLAQYGAARGGRTSILGAEHGIAAGALRSAERAGADRPARRRRRDRPGPAVLRARLRRAAAVPGRAAGHGIRPHAAGGHRTDAPGRDWLRCRAPRTGPLPRATGPMPRATGPLPRPPARCLAATGPRASGADAARRVPVPCRARDPVPCPAPGTGPMPRAATGPHAARRAPGRTRRARPAAAADSPGLGRVPCRAPRPGRCRRPAAAVRRTGGPVRGPGRGPALARPVPRRAARPARGRVPRPGRWRRAPARGRGPRTGPMPQAGGPVPPAGRRGGYATAARRHADGRPPATTLAMTAASPTARDGRTAGYDGSWYPEEPQWDGGFPETDPNLRYREPGPGMPGYRGSREHRYGGDRY